VLGKLAQSTGQFTRFVDPEFERRHR